MADTLTWEQYETLYRQHGSHARVAKALGRDPANLRRWRRRHKAERAGAESCHEPVRAAPQTRAEGPSTLLKLLTQPRRVDELADLVDKGPATVRAWLSELQRQGYNVQQVGELWRVERFIAPAEAHVDHSTSAAHRRIAIVSDTQLGSRYQQLAHLNNFYDRAQAAGVSDVYHAGDVLAGVGVYHGQHRDIFLHTEDEQIDYAVEHYPQREGMKTHTITGNHDLVFARQGGSDPLRSIAGRRPDIDYLGPYSAWVQLAPNCTMYLLHPDGAPAYALSYKLQKIIESFEGGNKPNILIVGHWHTFCTVFVRNVHGMLAMCFESQTDHERRHALQPAIGGIILDIDFSDEGRIHSLRYECVNYLVPKNRDY